MFSFTSENTKCNIKVGYISSERGLVEDVGIYEANRFAQLNPGTQFIFRNRDFVKYLNINEVNKLVPDEMLPSNRSADGSCSGIVGLNLEGDTSKSIDETLNTDPAYTGGSTQNSNVIPELPKTAVNFYGGGGVGVQAAPIIGIDGSVLAVQVIHGGYGYKYPPIVDIYDDTGNGAGVVAKAIIKTRTSNEPELVEEFDAEEDYEEYVLDKCVPEMENVGYGQRWGPDGKDLGKWDPSVYFTKSTDPIRYQIQRYQKFLQNLKDGTRIDGDRIKSWWTTRQQPPLRVTSRDKVTREIFNVYHWAWGSKPATNDAIDNLYIKLFGRNGEPSGLAYWKNLQASGQSLAQIEEGMKTFPEWEKVCRGKCKPVMPEKTVSGNQYFEYDKDNFMNKYAVSPIPMSNAAASDNAGKNYVLEWEEEFPWDGDYVFNLQADNEAYLYVDNDPVGDKIILGTGGAAGNVLSAPQKIQKYMSGGMHKISIDLVNLPIIVQEKVQRDIVETSDEVKFDISISSLFANGITIEGLGVDVSKEYGEGKNIKESITKKVEYGRVYPVKMRSSGFKQETSSSTAVNFSGLKKPGDVRFANLTRLEFDDDSSNGFDINASFTIDKVNGGTAKFTSDAKGIDIKGDKVEITLTYSWSDNPRKSGTALDSIKIGNTTWTHLKQSSGSETHTITLSGSSSNSANTSNIKLKTKGEKVIAMEDLPGQAAGSAGVGFFDDIICSVNNGRFYGISGSSCSFIVDPPENQDDSGSTERGERPHVFNTVDWISRANRKLWKINPLAGADSDFASRFGVLPFDPTEVVKVEKKKTPVLPSVKFEVGDDGKTYLKVMGNGRVKVGFQMDVDDEVGNRFGAAVKEVKIQTDDGELILRRSGTRFEKLSGTGAFSSGKKYLIKSLGGSQTSGSFIGADKTVLQFDDAVQYGFDGRGYVNVKVKSINLIPNTQQIESYFGYPDYPNASTDDYAGFHEIIWNNLNFPEDGNYAITTMVDDNVVLTFSKPNKPDIILNKEGFRIRGDARTGKGKSTEIKYFESGNYTLKAVLEQVPGAALAHGNPMVLALDIEAAFVSNDRDVISPKSWNQNPLAISMTIDAPMAPKIVEDPQLQEGRCPKNPIWTTRLPADEGWYPVRTDAWGKFMNRYAISPIPPLGLKGTDGAGTVYRNSWKVELPYKGFYGVKGTVDNFGKLFIDGVEVLGPDIDNNFQNYNSIPNAKKIFLEKKTIDITVEVENEKQFIWQTIDQKVFSTADWASKQNTTSTTIEGAKNVDVNFKVSTASLYANSITLKDNDVVLFEEGKIYGGPNINASNNLNIEVGKVYDVVLTSSNTNTSGDSNGIQYNGLKRPGDLRYSNAKRLEFDDDSANGFDINASFTIDNVVNGNASFAEDGKSFIVKGSNVQVTLTYNWNDNPRRSGTALSSIKIGSTTWTHLRQSNGSETHTITLSDGKSGIIRNDGSNNSGIRLRNKGKNVIQMEDWTDNDWADIICSATDGEFYNLQGRTCKFKIPSKDKTTVNYGKGLTSGSTKNGVTYSGPPLSTYSSGTLGPFITPTFTSDEDYIANFNGKTWTMTWDNVEFVETGTYDIQAQADDSLIIKVDGVEAVLAEVGKGLVKSQFNVTEGKRTIELTLTNLNFNAPFSQNPTVAAVKITRKVDVAKVDPRSGTALGKPWTVNPIGVSAILIPPPCPKKINGVGIVTDVIITDPGNGFDPPVRSPDPDVPSGPPCIMEIDKIIPEDEGINYGPDDKVCIVNQETGEEVCFIPPKGPFGEIPEFDPRTTPPGPPGPPDPTVISEPPPAVEPDVGITAIPSVIVKGNCTNLIYTSARNTSLKIDKGVGNVPVVSRGEVKVCPPVTTTYTITGDGGSATTVVTVVEDPNDPLLDSPDAPDLPPAPNGYRSYPSIIVRGRGTGISYKGIPVMKAVLDPIGVDPNRLIQVTDLPGLKQTGYYDGKPYYGAVFYENGIRYAGYYDTPGQKVQIYDTMQESIDATVTTPPSAIQRQGTDINSNNPRLNIPGTPDNLT